MIIYIYKNTTLIAKPQAKTMEEFKNNPTGFFPSWTNDMTASEVEFRNPKLIDGQLVEKTRLDLVLEGSEQLAEGEIIQGTEIITIPRPSEMLKPVWVVAEWVESATQEEIEEHNFKESVIFYNSELEFASKATAELACEIIDQDTFESVKEYMRAIDPYSQVSRKVFSRPQRPPVFDRYN